MPKLSGAAKAAIVIGGILIISVIVNGNKNNTGSSPRAPVPEAPRSSPPAHTAESTANLALADNDTVQFDPQDRRDSQIVQGYVDATDVCLSGRAEALLHAGVRSRAEIVKQAGDLCGPTLKRILIEHKFAGSEAQADTWIEVMAEKAVNRMLDR